MHDQYVSPFSERYASREMQHLFSAQTKFSTWRKLWVLLATCQKQLGLPITDAQIQELQAHTDDIDFSVAGRYEAQFRHDVMAHVHAYADQCPTASAILHLGATSMTIGDNTDILILRDAYQLVLAKLAGVASSLADFAMATKAMPTLAYTHFQPAQPTTVGKRACLWLYDVMLDMEAVQHRLSTLLPLGCKGTTGTGASFLQLFDGDVDKVEALDQLFAHGMGFARAVPISGQTYTRKTDSDALDTLSGIAQSAHKFSNDIRLLAHMKQIEEPFEKTQIGSSAMAYKRNPMRAERMAALSRFVINNALNGAHTAAEQWLERTLDDSANRRLSIAEGFLAADGLLNLYGNLAKGLVVYPKVIAEALQQELPFMATENILMAAVKKGGDRQTLHEAIRVHSMAAASRVKEEGLSNDLLSRIADDPVFGLAKNEIDALMDPVAFTGLAERQVERFVENEVRPALQKLTKVEGALLRV